MFMLSCRAHYHLRTPKAVTAPGKLLCAWCEPPARLAAARLRQATEPERAMHAAFGRYGVFETCVRETRLPWWHGQLDFWFPSHGVAVQVDGPHHFAVQPRTPHARQQATIDCSMCAAAWRAGVGLVRVHHLHVWTRAAAAAVRLALDTRGASPTAPVLVLGEGFAPRPGVAIAGCRDAAAFLAALQDALGATPRLLPSGWVLFSPHPPPTPTNM